MKNRLVQVALGLIFLAILVQIVLIAPSQIRDSEKHEGQPKESHEEPPTSPAQAHEGAADQSIDGMHMIETQEGRKEWELWSDKALSHKAKDIVELEKVRAIFFSDSGVTFTVTGQRGNVEVKTKNLRVEGDVVTRSSNGYIFRTPAVDYTSSNRMLRSTQNVEMDGPSQLHLLGLGMNASLLTDKIEVLSDVRAEKGLAQGRTAYIKSHRAIFSNRDRTARFLENVILDMDTMRITGPDARFNYDNNQQEVKSVLFSGGARVSDTDKWATAQNVMIDFDANKFVFSGDPRVVQNNDELRGEEIVFLDGGKQVEVRSARARVDEKRVEKKPGDKF